MAYGCFVLCISLPVEFQHNLLLKALARSRFMLSNQILEYHLSSFC